MGKSSASLKKKRSKDSSKSRSRKKSKSKGRRNKFKKLRRGEDSVSHSDDSHSRSSVSVSSSSSEDGHRSRRSQSRTRRDVKGSKKRPRRPSYSNESREEASSRLRKRKRSKRNDEYEGRKRSHPKKKLRRDVSVSSKSSESLSCSTCRGGNSSDESEFERKRGRSERRDKNKRRLDKVKTGNKSRDRSRSHSLSPRRGASSGYRSEEKLTGENNSRRLKSIITVIKEDNDDGNKEEIVYDHDDYPSCRSNDSNDGGSKKELACHSHVASEKKRHVEDEKGEEAVVSNIGTSGVAESSKGGENQCDGSNPSCDGIRKSDAIREKSGQVSGAGDSLKGDDLESILRQRALANLTKFRGGMQTNAKTPLNEKDKSDNNVKPPSTEEAESVQVKSAKVDGSTVGGATPVSKRISMPAVREDSQNYRKVPDGNDGGKESGSTKHNFASPRNLMAAGGLKEKVNVTVGSFTNKPKLVTSVWRRESSNTSTTPKQTTTPQESPQAKLMSGSSIDKSAAETAQTLTPKSGTSKDEVNNTRDSASEQTSSSLKPESGDVNSDKLQGEAKDGQFEQKTMSVMRGGEMVQVSYKVYIPKKAPALARRPLKR